MEDLHGDAPARDMHPVGYDAVVRNVFRRIEARRARKHAALRVRGHAAGDHQRHAAAGPRRIEVGDPVPVLRFLKPGVHGPHQHPVLQRHVTQFEWGEHMREIGHGWHP